MLPTVSKFLFCLPLRLGTATIAWLQVVYGLFGIAAIMFILSVEENVQLNVSVYIILYVCFFVLGCVLLKGVFRENINLILLWIKLQIFVVIFELFIIFFFTILFWISIFTKEKIQEDVNQMVYALIHFGNICL